MPRLWIVRAGALGLICTASADLAARTGVRAPPPAAAAGPRTISSAIGVWQPPIGGTQVPLWPARAPDTPAGTPRPERSQASVNPTRFDGRPVTGVFDVSVPTMTVFPARTHATGAAVLVFPGGGFERLAIDLEGTEACDWLTARGIACILVKYRVPNGNHHYDAACRCVVTPAHLTALQDAQRAIRLVRARAPQLHIDPDRIGVMGFSAGGYLVAQTSTIVDPAYTPVDAIDRLSSRPDFAIALYPGHLCRAGDTLDPAIHVNKRTPPTFLVQAWDDPTDDVCNSTVYARALDAARVPAEVHLFGSGGHAFALRRTGHGVDVWPSLLERWLRERQIL